MVGEGEAWLYARFLFEIFRVVLEEILVFGSRTVLCKILELGI